MVFTNTDATLWKGAGGYGRNNSIIADIDRDGVPEIIAGNTAYRSGWDNLLDEREYSGRFYRCCKIPQEGGEFTEFWYDRVQQDGDEYLKAA